MRRTLAGCGIAALALVAFGSAPASAAKGPPKACLRALSAATDIRILHDEYQNHFINVTLATVGQLGDELNANGDADAYIRGVSDAVKDMAKKTLDSSPKVDKFEATFDREAEKCRLWGLP